MFPAKSAHALIRTLLKINECRLICTEIIEILDKYFALLLNITRKALVSTNGASLGKIGGPILLCHLPQNAISYEFEKEAGIPNFLKNAILKDIQDLAGLQEAAKIGPVKPSTCY